MESNVDDGGRGGGGRSNFFPLGIKIIHRKLNPVCGWKNVPFSSISKLLAVNY
jgi:hypothetical protein